MTTRRLTQTLLCTFALHSVEARKTAAQLEHELLVVSPIYDFDCETYYIFIYIYFVASKVQASAELSNAIIYIFVFALPINISPNAIIQMTRMLCVCGACSRAHWMMIIAINNKKANRQCTLLRPHLSSNK